MVRDKHRGKEHFIFDVNTKSASHKKRVKKLELGQIQQDRVKPLKQLMATNLIQKAVSNYSLGCSISDLNEDFISILDLIEESWTEGARKLVGTKGIVLDQYVIDGQIDLLRLLSIGFLINASNNFFQRLGGIIRNDNVVDLIFELILAAKLDTWEARAEPDSYAFKLYRKLKSAIIQEDKVKAEKLIKSFLEIDWLKEQKSAQMLTETEKDWYYGRWSFESAAITCIKGLDDSSYRDHPYYPKDLADYYRANH
ncbi:MAG: PoNe immunity protein domain-containing protein [Bacteroidota bacterium]